MVFKGSFSHTHTWGISYIIRIDFNIESCIEIVLMCLSVNPLVNVAFI